MPDATSSWTAEQQTAFSFASPLGQTFATGCIGFESCGIDPHAWALDFIVTIVSLESIYIAWRYPAEDEDGKPHPQREALRKRDDWTFMLFVFLMLLRKVYKW